MRSLELLRGHRRVNSEEGRLRLVLKAQIELAQLVLAQSRLVQFKGALQRKGQLRLVLTRLTVRQALTQVH